MKDILFPLETFKLRSQGFCGIEPWRELFSWFVIALFPMLLSQCPVSARSLLPGMDLSGVLTLAGRNYSPCALKFVPFVFFVLQVVIKASLYHLSVV